MTYTKVNAEPLAETTKSEPLPKILELFLPIVKLLDAKLLPLSIKVTSFPTAGDAGRLIVIAVPIPLPEVSINTWSPLTVVYVVVGV